MKVIHWLGLALLLASCSTSSKKAEQPITPPPQTPAEVEAAVRGAEAKPPQAPAAESTTANNETATAAKAVTQNETAAAAPKKDNGISAKQSLLWLQHGNTRFVKNRLRKDGQSKKDIARLVKGQHPHAVVLSCSDSRVPPEIVFDQKLGEIFVVRTAGEALDNNAIGSIEYALEQLNVKLILVMGHTYCGAVKAAIQVSVGGDTGSVAFNHIIAGLQPHIMSAKANGAKVDDDVAREAMANAQGVAEDLKKLSPIIRNYVEKGGVEIKAALYHMNSGAVSFE